MNKKQFEKCVKEEVKTVVKKKFKRISIDETTIHLLKMLVKKELKRFYNYLKRVDKIPKRFSRNDVKDVVESCEKEIS